MNCKIKQYLITIGILVVLIFVGIIYKSYNEENNIDNEIVIIGQEESEQNTSVEDVHLATQDVELIYVYICGAVEQEGVYEVPEGTRVYEVVQMAGGLRDDAAVKSINQARTVSDGEQIVIATEAEEMEANLEEQGLISINTASVEQLCEIPGVGESRASDIIAYREANGPFQTKEELMNVSGIKEATYGKMEAYIRVE